MPRELIANAREELAFRQFESAPLAKDQVRVRTQQSAAEHGSAMAPAAGYAKIASAPEQNIKLGVVF